MHRSFKPNRRMLTNTLSLRFYERVRKQYHLKAAKRGAFILGPVKLQSGDLFGLRRHERVLEQLDELVVYPLVVPVAAFDLATSHPFGEQSSLRRLVDDPLRIAGTRPYAPGDNPRHLHWKATAHRGSLQTKTFDPSATLRTAIFLDIQTVRGTPAIIDSYLEYGIIAAASLARHLLDRGEAVGLYVNAPRRHTTQRIRLAPSRHPEQWQAILEALARVPDLPSVPFERFLRSEQAGLSYGVPILAITAVVGPGTNAALLDLQRAGHPIALVAVGDEPPVDVPGQLRCAWIGGETAYTRLTAAMQPADGVQREDSPIGLEFGV